MDQAPLTSGADKESPAGVHCSRCVLSPDWNPLNGRRKYTTTAPSAQTNFDKKQKCSKATLDMDIYARLTVEFRNRNRCKTTLDMDTPGWISVYHLSPPRSAGGLRAAPGGVWLPRWAGPSLMAAILALLGVAKTRQRGQERVENEGEAHPVHYSCTSRGSVGVRLWKTATESERGLLITHRRL